MNQKRKFIAATINRGKKLAPLSEISTAYSPTVQKDASTQLDKIIETQFPNQNAFLELDKGPEHFFEMLLQEKGAVLTELIKRQNKSQKLSNQDVQSFLKLSDGLLKQLTILKKDSDIQLLKEVLGTFNIGGMSFGSLGLKTFKLNALVANMLGFGHGVHGGSCSGEGGQISDHYKGAILFNNIDNVSHQKGALSMALYNHFIKQIASGRFGVNTAYVVSASNLEIKIAQGAKPGEGGQLMGHKVEPIIAEVRNTNPKVTLISPPPNHDLYSIESLSHLIHSLHQVNPTAGVTIKLVSGKNIGPIALGCYKTARAAGLPEDRITIGLSGNSGGTGASDKASISHAGLPLEIGLAEVRQIFRENGISCHIKAGGGLYTAEDAIRTYALGATSIEWGTLTLVAQHCIMAKECHNGTCPRGITTNNPEYEKLYAGKVSETAFLFVYLAEQIVNYLNSVGLKSVHDLVGNTQFLQADNNGVVSGIERLLYNPKPVKDYGLGEEDVLSEACSDIADEIEIDYKENNLTEKKSVDTKIMEALYSKKTSVNRWLSPGPPLTIKELPLLLDITNEDLSAMASVSGLSVREPRLFPESPTPIYFTGTAGQSFCAFLTDAFTVVLEGNANDHVASAQSGGNILIKGDLGCVARYGATEGTLTVTGNVGDRFGIRESGGTSIVAGDTGIYPYEYKTGGYSLVLGALGYRACSGMSDGVVYFLKQSNTTLSIGENPETMKPQTLKPITPEDAARITQLLEKINPYLKETVGTDLMEQFLKIQPQNNYQLK